MPSDFFTGLAGTNLINTRSFVDTENLFATASSPVAGPVFIDLSEQSVTSNIVRGGFLVPEPNFDPGRYNDWIDTLVPSPYLEVPRVVQQSIPAKRKVPPGTAVDLRLERPNIIPVDIFSNVHEDLRGEKVSDVAGSAFFSNVPARNALLKYSSAAEVPAAERTVLINAFGSSGVAVVETDPNKTFERAFNTFRNAAAFR
jgi:hypothetical protein